MALKFGLSGCQLQLIGWCSTAPAGAAIGTFFYRLQHGAVTVGSDTPPWSRPSRTAHATDPTLWTALGPPLALKPCARTAHARHRPLHLLINNPTRTHTAAARDSRARPVEPRLITPRTGLTRALHIHTMEIDQPNLQICEGLGVFVSIPCLAARHLYFDVSELI